MDHDELSTTVAIGGLQKHNSSANRISETEPANYTLGLTMTAPLQEPIVAKRKPVYGGVPEKLRMLAGVSKSLTASSGKRGSMSFSDKPLWRSGRAISNAMHQITSAFRNVL